MSARWWIAFWVMWAIGMACGVLSLFATYMAIVTTTR